MKTKLFAVFVPGMAAVLCLAGVSLPQSSNAQTESAPVPAANDSIAPAAPDEPAALPSNIDPSSALAQIVKLIQAGVSEDVIMAYATNSTSLFHLDPDKIIYLKDIGAPDELVTAMMQRDQALQTQMASAAYQSPPQPAPATETTAVVTTDVAPPPTLVNVDYFYNTLAPYGSWVNVAGYGQCWRPTVVVYNAGWQPYCDHGHWIWTDCGWYWLSDYSWGWAPFHYGRWFRDARLGWCWYPGTVWGPSWVTWRYSANYCGWAPLPPAATFVAGIGFTYHGSAVSVGFNFGLGASAFTFVPTANFCDPHPRRHCVPPAQVAYFYNQTTVINNFGVDPHNRNVINHGIDPGRITAVSHREIRPVAIHESSGHVARGEQLGRDGQTLYVNRPRFSDNPPQFNQGGTPHPTPSQPAMSSAYQGSHNGNQNNNPMPPRNNQPAWTTPPSNRGETPYSAPSRPAAGSAFQGLQSGNPINNPSPSHNYQSMQTTPVPSQRQFSPPDVSVSPGHAATPQTAGRSPAAGNRPAPGAAWHATEPNNNLNTSADNRRYPSPRAEQIQQQSPRANPGHPDPHVGAALQTPSPAAHQPGATQGGSQQSHSPSQATGNQPIRGVQSSSPPAQSQANGRDRNQNGQ